MGSIKTYQQAWGPLNAGRGREGKMKPVSCWVVGTTTAQSISQGKRKVGSQLVALSA